MSFSIRRIFSNLFLSAVIENSECKFYGRVFRNGKVINTINAKFTEIDPTNIDKKVFDYIKRLEKSYSNVYISLFFSDESQGALPTTRQDEYEKFNINSLNLMSINMQDNWSIYGDIMAIRRAKDTFGDDSVDLIYSPIALMYYELLKRGISDKTTLYLYNHTDSLTLCIFSNGQMRLSTFFKIVESENTQPKMEQNFKEEDITDIDNLIVKEENEAGSVDEFKSLDEMLNGDKFKEFEDLGYDLSMPASADVAKSVAIFGRDMSMFRYITMAIKEYYHNPIYKGDFIEQVIILDNTKISATFMQFLQSELFVETSVYPINTLEIMNELMISEIKI
ncbi:hypothetical protein KDD93_04400 [Campylobacter sp. faydin G-24]|uniref:Clan AA aspartic protease n=1 Tax=Campylobacter anatolicus TaxID=2829105 RepID=A0ABS5HIE5_9BACT|nr:hypothetical protein [Campylobacter anatolicus]MBR8462066.1 hypothetical protein [Campylobacter anatolicus]MBR8463816.1 hypothetical protein [Campylobacter anatolicus]MBR8464847.1 hypothetical protein [Campylobacter anatolicus]